MRYVRCWAVPACVLLLPTAALADAVAESVQAALAARPVGHGNIRILAGGLEAYRQTTRH